MSSRSIRARACRSSLVARVGAVIIVLAWFQPAVGAQGTAAFPTFGAVTQPAAAPARAAIPPRVGITGEASITLQQAIGEALANNRDIAASRVALEQTSYTISAAEGAYDPRLALQSSFQRQVTPVSSIIGGSASGSLTQDDVLFGPQLTGLLPKFGGRYQASYTSRRQTSDNQFTTLNPQFPTSLALTFTQPLFRGLRYDDTRRQIDVGRKNADLSDEQFRQRVMDITAQTEQAYWELVFAQQNLTVQAEGLGLARQQVEGNQRLADQGVAAPIDVVEARTQVATFEQNVYGAQTAVTRAENALKSLMLPDRSAALWSTALRPVTDVNVTPRLQTLDEAVNEALANRPELAQARVSLEANEVNTRFFREQTRPEINLVGTYTTAGLAGQTVPSGPNPLTSGLQPLLDRLNTLSGLQGLPALPVISAGGSSVPELLVGGYGQSLGNLLGQNFPTFQVGVQISLPFRNQTAEANLASSLADARRIGLQRQALELAIQADVRNAMQAVQSAQSRLAASEDARRSAEEQYASEQRRFQAGTSTVFFVLQRQTAMIATRTQYARAEADLGGAISQLERATGGNLKAHNINLK